MNKKGERVYVYCRASRTEQEDSPNVQLGLIRTYVDAQNLGSIDCEFIDPGVSGGTSLSEREAGREMMARLKKGDHVIIAKLDRGFRSLRDACATLETFKKVGVKLHVVNLFGGSLDLSSPIGLFVFQILAAFAELERSMIRERCSEGMKFAHATRDIKSMDFVYGFRWVKTGSFVSPKNGRVNGRWKKLVDESQRPTINRIKEMRDSGMTYDAMRHRLNRVEKIPPLRKKTREWHVSGILLALAAYDKMAEHERLAAEKVRIQAELKKESADE